MSRQSPHTRIPGYCRHKARGTAYVRLDGKVHYLPGPYGSPQSKIEYDRLVALWQLNGRRLPPSITAAPSTRGSITTLPNSTADVGLVRPMSSEVAATSTGITVTELIDAFLLECDREYPPREGKRNTELACIESALFSLHRLYGPTLAEAFKPVYLDTVVRDYIARGFCRKMVNRYLSYCKRLFKWGVRHEHISGETFYKLLTVEGLRKGRSSARDNPQVHPVEEAIVEATLSYLSEEVAAMVRLQLLTGMRSGEVTRLRPCDLDRSGVVWRYSLEKHKTAHHGIMRQVPLGPKAQAIITPFLTADPMAYLFSPARAEAKRRAKMHEQRRTPLSCGNVPGSNRKERPRRVPGERYDSDSYGKAIRRGCRKAFPFPQTLLPDTRQWKSDRKANFIAVNGQETFDAHHAKVMEWYKRHFWHPHQLRHTASTRVARTFGEIASQNLLGHSSLKTTAIYTERDWRKAEEVMAAVG